MKGNKECLLLSLPCQKYCLTFLKYRNPQFLLRYLSSAKYFLVLDLGEECFLSECDRLLALTGKTSLIIVTLNNPCPSWHP